MSTRTFRRMLLSRRGVARTLACVVVAGSACGGENAARSVEHHPDAADTDGSFIPDDAAALPADASLPDAFTPPDDASAPVDDAGPSGPDPSHVQVSEPALVLFGGEAKDLFPEEQTARDAYTHSTITLRGRVSDEDQKPLAHASVRIDAFQALTNAQGEFEFSGLARKNRLLSVQRDGFRDAFVPVHLFEPPTVEHTELLDIRLTPRRNDVTRFLFAGDTSWARHFMDSDDGTPPGELPPDDPSAYVQVSSPLEGARSTLRFVKPLFSAVDFPSANLETAVTHSPDNPHPTKDFVLFSLPGALPALAELGFSFVNIANNHVYDYLEPGIADTLAALDNAGLAHSGAGSNVGDAFTPVRTELSGHAYSFIGATSVRGETQLPLNVASDAPPPKGGAADATDHTHLADAIANERAQNRVPIVQLHTGTEYTARPTADARALMSQAVQAGAALVIAHHPHVAQGFGREAGVLIAHSLGNFCFDQDRLETFLSVLTQLDMAGDVVANAHALPIYLEDYRPRPVTGDLARGFLRRIGEDSLSDGVTLIDERTHGLIADATLELVRTRRELTLPVSIATDGSTVLDLRTQLQPGESLVSLSSDGALNAQVGTDILLFGDFEDWDVDDDTLEEPRWALSGSSSRYPCLHEPHGGNVALCVRRTSSNSGASSVLFGSRVRYEFDAALTANKDVSLVGYVRGDNAGKIQLKVSYEASAGSRAFCAPGVMCGCTEVNVDCHPASSVDSFQSVLSLPAGTRPWTQFAVDLAQYADTKASTSTSDTYNTRALRLKLFHFPPAQGSGIARFDDLAVVSWRAAHDLSANFALSAPNPVDFVRVRGPAGEHQIKLVIERVSRP